MGTTSLQSTEVLGTLLGALADGVIAHDAEGRLLYANEAAARLTGSRSADELRGASAADLLRRAGLLDETGSPLAPDLLPARRVLAGDPQARATVRLVDAGAGDERWYEVTATAVRDERGAAVAVVNVFRDVTAGVRHERELAARAGAESALRASEAHYRELADATPALLWQSDADGRCTFVNRAWLELTGRTLEQELGDGWTRQIHPDDHAHGVAAWQAAVRGRTRFEVEYRMRAADGSWRTLLSVGAPRFAPDGTYAGHVGSCIDVTERTRVERQREIAVERAARLQSLTAALSEALEPQEVARVVVREGIAALGADAGLVALLAADDHLDVVESRGYPDEIVARWPRVPVDATVPIAEAVRTREPVVVHSLEERTARYPALADIPSSFDGWLAVPMLVDGDAIGALALSFRTLPALTEDDHALVTTIGRQCAQAVRRASLFAAEHAARAEAERQERLARTIADNATSGLYMLDPRGHPTYLNPAVTAMTGFTLEEIAGRPAHLSLHHCHPDGRSFPIEECPIDRALTARERLRDYETSFVRRDGTIFPVVCAASPILHDGEAVGTLVEVRDVSEEKRALATLRERESRLRRIAESGIIGLFYWSLSGGITEANDAFLEMLGYTRDDLAAGRVDWRSLTPPEWHAKDDERVDELLRTGRHGPYEKEYFANDGRRVPVLIASAFFDRSTEQGVCVCVDLTERARATQRLAFLADASARLASSLEYETTLQTVAEFAVPAIADLCIVELREDDGTSRVVAVAHSDPSRTAIVQRALDRYPVEPDAPAGRGMVLRTGRPDIAHEITDEMLRAIAHDDEHLAFLRWVGVRSSLAVPLRTGGRTFGVLSFVLAESGRRFTDDDLALAQELAHRASAAIEHARLYAAAQAASRAKADFLATMSHEMRTPINAILGYSELLTLGIAGALADAPRAHVGRIQASARHLMELVDDVLDMAKIESGTVAVGAGTWSASDAIAAALAAVRPQAEAKRLELEEACAAGAQYVGDEQRVRQILLNLLSNAVKFTEADGRITLRCAPAAAPPAGLDSARRWLRFDVADTGIGIPADQHEAIFDPFVQGSTGYTRTTGGTGLGLTISRRLARLMGGELTLESAPGTGSTFTLWIPAA